MRYEYACPFCHLHTSSPDRSDFITCKCGEQSKRIWGFRQLVAFQPHFNHAVGQWVNNKTELMDAGKRGGEEMNNRLGVETNYQIVDSRELGVLGVTPEVIPQVAERFGTDAARKIEREVKSEL